ncbi:MAG: transposase [Planctomycetes bacterium]|nr:transposase [Planctomycetota bacterium]
MAYLRRIVLPGHPHHVTQRAAAGQGLFRSDADRLVYLDLLRREARRAAVRVVAYCLLPDRVDLILTPASERGLALAVGRTHCRYARYLSRACPPRARRWEPRFHSCALDEHTLVEATLYVERGPVWAGQVRFPWRSPWSSAGERLGMAPSNALLSPGPFPRWLTHLKWKEFLRDDTPQEDYAALCRHTRRGWPYIPDPYLGYIEARLGRRLRPLPLGRPRTARTPRPRTTACVDAAAAP